MRGVHPRIYLTSQRTAELCAAIKTTHAAIWEKVRDQADRAMRQGPPAYIVHDRASGDEQLWQREVGNTMPVLAMAYALTGEKQYLDAARRWALASCGYKTWGLGRIDGTDLATGHQLFGLALVYDWCYHDLGEETSLELRFHTEQQADRRGTVFLAKGKQVVLQIEPLTTEGVQVSSEALPMPGRHGERESSLFAVRVRTRQAKWHNAVSLSWFRVGDEPTRVALRTEGRRWMFVVRDRNCPRARHPTSGARDSAGRQRALAGVNWALRGKSCRKGEQLWGSDYAFWSRWERSSVSRDRRAMLLPNAWSTAGSMRYFHTALIYEDQVMCCMAEPKVYEILRWQLAQVHKHVQPDGYFLQHDEIRVQGWDESCRRSGKTPGEQLAENVRKCTALVRKEDPGKPIYVWSDMFDPQHNAPEAGRYYLVKGNGPWYGSWKGLDKDVVIVNWNSDPAKRTESLKHFASLGHRQILAGYYDGPVGAIRGWLRDSREIPGISGAMYTTWQHQYRDLEAFAAQLGQHGAVRP